VKKQRKSHKKKRNYLSLDNFYKKEKNGKHIGSPFSTIYAITSLF